jgi:hypothetical protein
MLKLSMALAISASLGLSGCASLEKSTWLGYGIGTGAGAGLGLAISSNEPPERRTQGALIGAIVGGLFGAVIGYKSFKDKERKEAQARAELNSGGAEMFGGANSSGNRATLKPAQVKVRYVEDQIKDGTFVPAHLEYEISDPAHWERSK